MCHPSIATACLFTYLFLEKFISEKEEYALMLYVLCYVWQVKVFRHKDICISGHQSSHLCPVPQNCYFFGFVSKNVSFCRYLALGFLLLDQTCLPQLCILQIPSSCLEFLWSSVLKQGSLSSGIEIKEDFWIKWDFISQKVLQKWIDLDELLQNWK